MPRRDNCHQINKITIILANMATNEQINHQINKNAKKFTDLQTFFQQIYE